MTPQQHQRVGELLDQVTALPAGQQQSDFLDAACGADGELRRQMRALLEAEARSNQQHQSVADDALAPGARLGAFVIEQQLGSGTLGIVYQAWDTKLERKAALKVLPPGYAHGAERVNRFRQEIRIISQLNHPNIAAIYAAELDHGNCYAAWEFVPGRTLRQLAPSIDPRLLLDVAIQISGALSAAHGAGIVHRDIKPENVMVRQDGVVKILDFGLMRLIEPDALAQAKPQSDLYSLGLMLYELATGVKPSLSPRRPSEILETIDPGLDALLMRAIEPDPEFRFQTAADFRSALQLLLRETATPPVVPAAAPAPVERKTLGWPAVIAAGAMAVAAVAGVAGYWASTTRVTSPRTAVRFDPLTSIDGEETFPSFGPDNRQFLYASAASGSWDIYLQRTGGDAPVNITAGSPNTNETEPALSPDGQRIAFRRDGAGIFVSDLAGQNAVQLTRGDAAHHPAWAPSGSKIVYSDAGVDLPTASHGLSRLHVVDVATGQSRTLQTDDAVQPSWSPSGSRIAYWGVVGGQRDIWTVDAQGLTPPVPVTNSAATDWHPVWSPQGDELYFLSDAGGSMNIWRIRIDERTGMTRGAAEPVTTPAAYVRNFNFSRDGAHIIYSSAQHRTGFFQFDGVRRQLLVPEASDMSHFSFSPDGGRVVYSTAGDEDLWVASLDGSQPRRRLTSGAFKHRLPQWSPAGDEILFLSNRAGVFDVWAIRADASGSMRQLTAMQGGGNDPLVAAVWIDQGARILASHASGKVVMLANPKAPVPDAEPVPQAGVTGIFASPLERGQLIGHLPTANELVVYTPATNTMTRLNVKGRDPVWAPGGALFLRDDGVYQYHLVQQRDRLVVPAANVLQLRAAPFDRRIFFSQTRNQADLWMLTLR